MWKIPLAETSIQEDDINMVVKTLQSGWLSMGEVNKQFEDACKKFLQTKHVYSVTNGTAALHLACIAAGFGLGDEVIVPSLSFVATSNVVLYVGAKPIFVDIISDDDLTISPDSIEEHITPRTRGIIVMHYGGYACDMDRIMEIAKKHKLVVIEDAAHSPGASLHGRKLGTHGDFGCFSFFPNKNITTGEGGLIATQNEESADMIQSIRSHGMTTMTWDRHHGHAYSYDVNHLGYNYRMDEVRASLGLVQLNKLEMLNQKRKMIVDYYRQSLENTGVNIPFSYHRGESSYHIQPVLAKSYKERNLLVDALRTAGVQTSNHYIPIHRLSYYKQKIGTDKISLPLTESVSDRLITLPLYPTMKTTDVDYIVDVINRALQKG